MHTRFTRILLMAAIAGCFATPAMAEQSYLDASSKMRGQYGNIPRTEYRANYRSMVSQPAMDAMAQAPSDERRFSYAPAQNAEKRATANAQPQTTTKAPQTAQNQVQTQRRFSYEPGTMNSGVMRNRQRSLPLYALPRTDSRKLGGG